MYSAVDLAGTVTFLAIACCDTAPSCTPEQMHGLRSKNVSKHLIRFARHQQMCIVCLSEAQPLSGVPNAAGMHSELVAKIFQSPYGSAVNRRTSLPVFGSPVSVTRDSVYICETLCCILHTM